MENNMWTFFFDMHSGGSAKTDYDHIFIQAESTDKAIEIFEDCFGFSPLSISCDCCGNDYSISSEDTLDKATKAIRRKMSLETYINQSHVRVIY
jgi:hypothetical protein